MAVLCVLGTCRFVLFQWQLFYWLIVNYCVIAARTSSSHIMTFELVNDPLCGVNDTLADNLIHILIQYYLFSKPKCPKFHVMLLYNCTCLVLQY